MPCARRFRVPAIGLGLLLAAMLDASAVVPDPFFPRHGNAGVDVLHYDLRLRVGTQANALEGSAALRIRATQALEAFRLDLHGLTVTRVSIDGQPAAFEQHGDKLAITLPDAVPRGGRFTAVVRYAGEADPLPDPSIEPGDGLTLGWRSYGRSSFVVSEPIGASTWFPCNDDLKDRATYRISVDVPSGFVAAANGRRVGVDDLGDRRRYRFEMTSPMTTWNATVNVNRFEIHRSRSSDGIPVTVYAPATTSDAAIRGFSAAKDILPYFAARFGRYPYDRYGSVALADPSLNFALETQTISLFPQGWYSSDVVAHELAHQWFGNAVAVKAWKDLWLAEGFATYAEVLWPNRRNAAQFHATMRELHARVQSQRLGPAVVDSADDIFSERTYFRGATVLYALQLTIGQDRLFDVLKAWTNRYRGRTVTTDDFIDTVVDVTGDASLRDFLQPWIYAAVVPALPASRVPPAGDAGSDDAARDAAQRAVAAMAANRHRKP